VVLKASAAFVASLLSAVLIVVVRAQVSPETGYGGLRLAPLEALLTAVFGPPVLWLLGRLDGRLDPALLRVGLSRRRARALDRDCHLADPFPWISPGKMQNFLKFEHRGAICPPRGPDVSRLLRGSSTCRLSKATATTA